MVSLDSPDAEFLKSESFKVHALGPGRTSWSYSSKLLVWLKKNIFDYDLIIVHGLWQYAGFATYLAFNKLKRDHSYTTPKLFIMPHGMLDPYFQKANGRRLKAIRNYFYWNLIENKLIHCADALLFTSQNELTLAATTFRPYHPKWVINIGYGIHPPPEKDDNISKAIFDKFPYLAGRPYLLYLSRIHEKKGLDLLIEAYSTFYKETDDSLCPNILIAGPGWDSRFGLEILEKIKALGLFNVKIFVADMLLGEEKWSAFYNAEAFILPSHQENFGIVIAEALACGKPVLTTNKVNIWEDIDIWKAGLVENDDQDGIVKLLKDFSELTQFEYISMCQNALKTFKEQYSIENTIKIFLSIIK